MLQGMDFINEMSGSPPEKEDLDFYNNLQRVENGQGAVGAAVDQYYDEDDMDDQDFDNLEPDEMMKMIEMQQRQQQMGNNDGDFSNMLAGGENN